MHSSVTVGGEFAGCTRNTRGTEVLNPFDATSREQLEAAFDEDLLGERVPNLNSGPFGRTALSEGVGRKDGRAADTVATSAGTEENDDVSDALCVREVKVFVTQCADGKGVDERVRLINRVEPGFAADVGQSETVSVKRDAAHDTVHDAVRVGVVDRAESQSIHDRNGTRTHRNDVANDSADSGRGALERLDV